MDESNALLEPLYGGKSKLSLLNFDLRIVF